MPPAPVITRFAPSPTGHLHIGGARTALFCLAYARKCAGRFVLRIEDTDQRRSSEAAAGRILEDLAWLGLPWDDGPEVEVAGANLGGDERGVGPFHQSKRLDTYNERIDALIASGAAYAAFETPDELEAKRREAIAQKVGNRYDRAALEIPAEERARRVAAGEEHVVRFRMPDEAISVHDEVLGEVTVGPDEFDDFIIRKRDGFPTYHLAVVVDDALMGVTHVLRGQEHLINTPRHIALQRAMGFNVPTYAHMPLIFNADGSKMSKRDKDKAVRAACKASGVSESPVASIDGATFAAWLKDKTRQLPSEALLELAALLSVEVPEIDVGDFQRAGYLPQPLLNFLALLGWNPKQKTAGGQDLERFDLDFLCAHFDFGGVGKTNAKFDRAKLLSFNADYIAEMSDEAFVDTWLAWAERYDADLHGRFTREQLVRLAPAMRPRCKTLRDVRTILGFVLLDDAGIDYDGKVLHKHLLKGGAKGLEALEGMRGVLAEVQPFGAAAIAAAVAGYASEHELGMGKVAQPIRVAVTGNGVSPPLGDTLEVIGRERALARIDRCLQIAKAEVSG